MTVVMMRAKAKPEHADDINSAATRMFAAIHEEQPQGIRYMAYRVGDTETFAIFLEVQDRVENPLPALDAVRAFQEDLRGGWLAETPSMEELSVVGEYCAF